MFYGPPSADEIKLQQLIELGRNSFKPRLTAAAYLVEHGGGPQEVGIENFKANAQAIVDFVTDTQDAFFDDIEELVTAIDTSEKDVETQEEEGPTESGYNYL